MKNVFVCQIYDTLSEKIIHTFMASNSDHARDQFRRFLDSVKKYSDVKNFILLYSGFVKICETSSDVFDAYGDSSDKWLGNQDIDFASDVGFSEEVSDESES